MFLKDIIFNDYKIFERMGEDNRKANISAVQYVHMLSATTNAKADTWNILEIFGRGEGNALVTDKNEINKRFFSQLEKLKSAIPEELQVLEPEIERQIKEATKELVNSQVRQFRDKAESARFNMEEHYKAAERKATEMVRYQNMLLSIQGKSNPILDDIRKVAAGSFFRFYSFDSVNISFITRNPVILVHKNPSAGIDITINMGIYRVTTDMRSMYTKVYQHRDNTRLDNFYHPHVSTGGDICWGTGGNAASGFMKDFRFLDFMELLASNLINYNAGNPYVSLERFKVKQDEQAGSLKLTIPTPVLPEEEINVEDGPYCENCDLLEEDCSCDEF